MGVIGSFWRSESGAVAAEYALLLAVIGSFIAFGATTLGQAISSALSLAGSVVSAATY